MIITNLYSLSFELILQDYKKVKYYKEKIRYTSKKLKYRNLKISFTKMNTSLNLIKNCQREKCIELKISLQNLLYLGLCLIYTQL